MHAACRHCLGVPTQVTSFSFTIFLGIEAGILCTVGVSILLVVKHTTLPMISVLGRVGNTTRYRSCEDKAESGNGNGENAHGGGAHRNSVSGSLARVGALLGISGADAGRGRSRTLPPHGGKGDGRGALEEDEEIKPVEGVLLVKLDSRMFFANANSLTDLLRRLEQLGSMTVHPSETNVMPPIAAVCFNMKHVPSIDASAVQVFYEVCHEYHL